jgi:hypothetical protein
VKGEGVFPGEQQARLQQCLFDLVGNQLIECVRADVPFGAAVFLAACMQPFLP